MGITMILMTMQLVVSGLGWIHIRYAQDVESDDCLAGHLIPKLDWPLTISCAEATDEVVFDRLGGFLDGIYTVVCWLHKLPSASFLLEVSADGGSSLVICHIECWLDALLL